MMQVTRKDVIRGHGWSISLLLGLTILMVNCPSGAQSVCPDHVCSRFFFWDMYHVCRNGETICTLFPLFDPCGPCPLVYENPFEEVEWTPSCSPQYDFYGSIYFCQDNLVFGYKTSPGGPCTRALAPLIRMQAGKRYQMRLVNNAGEDTNIHTHGLRIPGDGNTDDITRVVERDQCLFYNWTIPSDHMDGTMWYHAHVHGRTEAQVNGGAMGVLLIDPADGAPARPDWIEATENERILLFSSEKELVFFDRQEFVNGDPNVYDLVLDRNTWHRLRIVVGDPAAWGRNITFNPQQCEVHHVATDGVWRNNVPDDKGPRYRFLVSGATRLDVAIRCHEDSEILYKPQNLRRVRILLSDVDGGDANTPLPSWTPPRPNYLQDLRYAGDPDEHWSVTMRLFEFMPLSDGGINGELYNEDVPLAHFTPSTLQEWTIDDDGFHPFHLHMYHMQIMNPGGCGEIYDEGEWYDTIVNDIDVDCLVRFRTDDIGGRVTLHCHVLAHEDAGLMGWVQIGNPSNGNTHISSQSCESECYAA